MERVVDKTGTTALGWGCWSRTMGGDRGSANRPPAWCGRSDAPKGTNAEPWAQSRLSARTASACVWPDGSFQAPIKRQLHYSPDLIFRRGYTNRRLLPVSCFREKFVDLQLSTFATQSGEKRTRKWNVSWVAILKRGVLTVRPRRYAIRRGHPWGASKGDAQSPRHPRRPARSLVVATTQPGPSA